MEELKLRELKFYRFRNSVNEIAGSIVIEIPVTEEKLKYFTENIEFKRRFYHLNFLFKIEIPSMRFGGLKEENYVKVTVGFYLGNTFYKEVTDRYLINKLYYGKETVCVSELDDFRKVCSYHKIYPNIVFDWKSLLNNMINNFCLYSNKPTSSFVKPQGYNLKRLIELLETLNNELVK